ASILLFIGFVVWTIVSVWMDMRYTLISVGTPKLEHDACARNKIKIGFNVPLDLLWYLSLSFTFLTVFFFYPLDNSIKVIYMTEALSLTCIGLVALARRFWLSKK